MTALALRQFSGMLPRYGEQHIDQATAVIARNCRLISGELQALKSPSPLHDFSNIGYTVRRAYRVVTQDGFFYKAFSDASVDFVKAPIVNDSYNRHYWTAQDQWPRYATEDMLEVDDPGLRLGIPAPSVAPTVVPAGTGGEFEETRVYVYTFVSEYGEESAPSPPKIVVGNADEDWVVSGLQGIAALPSIVPEYSAADFNLVTLRLYRTITGTLGAVEYFS